VKYLVEHVGLSEKPGGRVYEERVVLFRASSFGEAIERAERHAEKYASELDGSYIRYCNAYRLFEDAIQDGVALQDATEVFSLMREVSMPPNEFLNRYHDDGTERTR
jgi:hypothetical protein